MDLAGVRSLMTTAIIMLIIFSFIKYLKEKRIRMISNLPISVKKMAFSRFLFVLFVWMIYIILYWISTSTAKPYLFNIIIWDTLSITGLIMFVNAFPYFFSDFNSCFKSRSIVVVLSTILVIFFFIVYISMFSFSITDHSWNIFQQLLPLQKLLTSISSTPIGVIFFILIGIIFSILNVLTFTHRKSYFE